MEAFLTILSSVVAAALAGGIVGHLVSIRNTDKIQAMANERAHEDRIYEQKVFLRKKYEEYGRYLCEALEFTAKQMNSPWNKDLYGATTKINYLTNLAVVYFAELREVSFEFVQVSLDFDDLIAEKIDRKSDKTLREQMTSWKDPSKLSKRYAQAKSNIIQAAAEHAHKYTFTEDTFNKKENSQ